MAQNTWTLDKDHSEIEFKVKHMMISNVKGTFGVFDIDIKGDKDDLSDLVVKLSIDTSSINTKNNDRDKHLKSGDFFDIEKYPEITFVSTSYSGDEITGDLTIKGVTKSITFNIDFGGVSKDPWGNEKAGFTVDGKIKRSDFGLNWNTKLDNGGVLVSEDVKFSADVQFVKS